MLQNNINGIVLSSFFWTLNIFHTFIPCSSTSIIDFEHEMPAGIIQRFNSKRTCAHLDPKGN